MTLALLITAVTGAWATEPKVINSEIDFESLKVGDILVEGFSISGPKSVMFYFNAGRAKKGETLLNEDVSFYRYYISSVGTNTVITLSADAGDAAGTYTPIDENGQVANAWIVTSTNGSGNSDFHLSGYKYVAPTAEAPVTVAWTASTKTGTFAMPGSDVVLTPIYANAAAFATTGTGSEATTLLPAAAEGVIAGTDASLIAEGTGIVANIGETTTAQGTLMYAIGTSDTEAPALTAFSATVPTAKNVADDGATVYVWYYIQGADAPQGEAATLDNTFNDTEPACLTVQVLTNKFDITFNAANANTIEAGKATVTVDGTDKTSAVTEGKLQGVKMGSEVKLKAATGYKFRKVEVKKKGDGPLAAAFKDGAKIKVGYQWNFGYTTYLEFTNSGGTYSLTSVSGLNEENGFNSSTLTAKNGNVLALDVVCQPNGDRMDEFGAQIEFDATSSTYKYSSKGSSFTGIISVSVNDTDITSQLTEAK